jgi:mannitol 2-dehydrogenase
VTDATAIPLTAARLTELAARVPVPTYDRARVRPGIVHLGVGHFHRAHEAMYLDRLLAAGGPSANAWGIHGMGILPVGAAMRDALLAQDGLYTLVLKQADGTWEPRVIGSIVRHLLAPDDPEAAVERLADPETRIVSLTITEGGYNFNQTTGEFDATNPDVVHDLRPGAAPRSVFGLVVEALARRRARGLGPVTLLSCDNIQHNGDVSRKMFGAFARLRDDALADWIDREVAFPNSMVDRITPATTDDDRAEVRRRFGVDDRWPVVCEPFTQWVLEDRFATGRPAYESVEVQLVEDVAPYEMMKLRLLNASHQALAYFGHLCGYRLVHDVAQDPLFARFLLAYMEREATPSLRPVPGIDLVAYRHQLVERFANPGVRDTVARLAAFTSDRIPKFNLPAVRDDLAAGRDVTLSAAIVASWARYAEGVDEAGEPIEVVDQMGSELIARARRWREEPLAFLGVHELFGELVDDERFTRPYLATLESLHAVGARATLERLLGA